jgi:hypothetical protein
MRAGRAKLWGATPLAWAVLVLLVGSQTLVGCREETLYDPIEPDRTPPAVAIQLPVAGSSVQSGARVPIRISASDSTGVASVLIVVTGVMSESIAVEYAPASVSVLVDTAVVVPADSVGSLLIGASATNARGTNGLAPAVTVTVTAPPL